MRNRNESEKTLASIISEMINDPRQQEKMRAVSAVYDELAFIDINDKDTIKSNVDMIGEIISERETFIDDDDFSQYYNVIHAALSTINLTGLIDKAVQIRSDYNANLENGHVYKWTAQNIDSFVADHLVQVVSRRFKIFGNDLFFVNERLFLEKMGDASMINTICSIVGRLFKSEFRLLDGSTSMKRFVESVKQFCTVDVARSGETCIQFGDCILKPNGDIKYVSDGSYPKYIFERKIADVVENLKPRQRVREVDDLLLHLSGGDEDTRRCLIDRLSTAFITSRHMKNKLGVKLVILLGSKGENGKSTFADLLERAFRRENFKTFSLKDFKGYFVADIENSIMAVEPEAAEVYLDADVTTVLKQVVTSDTIMTRQIYDKPRNITPFTQLVICTNSAPKAEDKTGGWARRLEWYEVDEKLVESESVKADPDKWFAAIQSDAAADYLFELLLVNAVKLMRSGDLIIPSEKVKKSTLENDIENRNPIKWLESDPSLNDWVVGKPGGLVYEKYEKWCNDGGHVPLGPTKFASFISDETGCFRKNIKLKANSAGDKEAYEWMAARRGMSADDMLKGGITAYCYVRIEDE